MHVEVTGGDLPGLRALLERMQQENRSVLVGVPAGKEEADGTSLALVAATNEFGSPEQNIPERSFLRGGIHDGAAKLRAVNVDSCKKILLGGMTVVQAVNKLGVIAVGEVKRKIVQGPFEALAPSTIARRKAKIGGKRIAAHKAKLEAGLSPGLLFRPLVDTGQLRQSITYQLENSQTENAKVSE
jgi:hypothetical protein